MKQYLLFFCLLILSACTFVPEGLNFVDVQKPAASHPLEVTLSMKEDSIYLYGDTKLSLNLNAFGNQINAAIIQYYDKKLSTDQPNYSFTITPQTSTDWVDLTISFYVSTGSGSIADKLKVENYFMSKTWKIKYFDLNKELLSAGYHIHPDGYLELYLITPKQKNNAEYGLSRYGNTIPVSRISGDTAFYADKSYCSDPYTYSFWYKYDSNNIFRRDVNVNLPKAELKFEAIGLDSCRVSWTKSPLKLYYTVNDTQYKGFGNEFNSSILIYENKYFNLKVFSPQDQNQVYSTYSVSANFSLGTLTNYFMCYSQGKDKFFISKDINLPYVESSGIPLPASDPSSYNNSRVNIICSPNGKYIAGYLYSQIYVYNENLSFSKKITADDIPNYKPYFSLTNDGVFTYLQGANIVMKNLSGTTDWDSFSFATDSDPNPNDVYFSVIANSIDGKYICVRGMNGFKIYDVSDHKTAKVVYDYPVNEIGAVVAHPTNPGLIYIKQNGIMQLRTCPGFELIKTIDIPIDDYYFHSIDSYSGIMLLMKDDYYYFVDPNTSKLLLKLKSGSIWNYFVQLQRNQFKTSQNVIDLTNYLKK